MISPESESTAKYSVPEVNVNETSSPSASDAETVPITLPTEVSSTTVHQYPSSPFVKTGVELLPEPEELPDEELLDELDPLPDPDDVLPEDEPEPPPETLDEAEPLPDP